MTYSMMNSRLDIYSDLQKCDTVEEANALIQVWYSLQKNGTQAALDYAKDYNAGAGQSIDDFNLDQYKNLEELTEKLNSDLESYNTQSEGMNNLAESAISSHTKADSK